MGLFGFGGGKKKEEAVEKKNVDESIADKQVMVEESKGGSSKEVLRLPTGPTATDVSVFEFGTAGDNEDKVTLAGYCPVSDEMEPCRWEVLPQSQSEAPGFRIVF